MADITFSPANPLPGQEVVMTYSGASTYKVISWHFGDSQFGLNSNLRTAKHTYINSGIYTVKVKSKSMFNGNVIIDTKNLSIVERRRIQFTPSRPGTAQAVSFKAINFLSDRLLWNFGDGNQEKKRHQTSHSYSKPGTYKVIVKEEFGDNRVSISTRISIIENRRVVYSPSNPAPGQIITIMAQNFSSDCIKWNFGDGKQIARGKKTETHSFTRDGSYRIEVRDYCGDYKPVLVNIRVLENRRLSFQPFMPKSGQKVAFSATNFISNCVVWNFGDGSGDIRGKKKEMHVFKRSGSFQVMAKDDCGKGAPIKVNVRITEDNRRLSYQPSIPKSGQKVIFSTTNFISNCVLWNFGDGSREIRGQAAIAHKYKNPGTFRVSAVDECGKNSYGRVELIINVIPASKIMIPLSITKVDLSFEDGKKKKRILKDSMNLKAIADLKFKGSGILKLQWILDNQIIKNEMVKLKTSNQMMFIINKIKSPFLPTNKKGKHLITLKVISPSQKLMIPFIEYTVTDNAPFVTSVYPAVVNQDQEYLLRLNGGNFNAQTVFDPGAGIKVLGKSKIKSSEEAELRIFVSVDIFDGFRFIKVRNNSGINSGPGKLIIKRLAETRSVDVELECPDITLLNKMKVEKLKPDSYNKTSGEHMTASNPHILTNESVLSWELNGNPMDISYYIINFYGDKKREKICASRKVPGNQSFLKSDFQLISELRKNRFPLIQTLNTSPCDPEYLNTYKADIYWTVQGYQTIDCPWAQTNEGANNKIRMVKDKINIKDKGKFSLIKPEFQKWPKEVLRTECEEFELLNLPRSWTGINCPENGENSGGISIKNLNREKIPAILNIKTGKVIKNESVDPNNYPLQEWAINGNIDTGYTPLAVSGNIIWNSSQSGMGGDIVKSVTFDNVFIDWGDGMVERLSASPDCEMIDSINVTGKEGRNLLKGRFNLHEIRHYYTKPGIYKVRICQLPNCFLPNSLKNNNSTDPEQTILNQIGQNTAVQLTNQNKTAFSNSSSIIEEIANVLDYGFLFYCQEVSITNRTDYCASGPLNLINVKITGFPAKAKENKLIKNTNSKLSKKKLLLKKEKVQFKYPQIPTVTNYEPFFNATADIKYFGTGSIEVRWLVDEFEVGKEIYHGLSSSQRQELINAKQQNDCSNALTEILTIDSPGLPVSSIGKRNLKVIARIIPSPSNSNFNFFISNQILKNSNPASVIPWVNLYLGSLPKGIGNNTNQDFTISDGVKISDLKEYQNKYHKKKGSVHVFHIPPVQVVDTVSYLVKDVTPESIQPGGKKPGGENPGESGSTETIEQNPGLLESGDFAWLIFPTNKGDFIISGVYGKLKKNGKKYSGEGVFVLNFTSGPDSIKKYGIPIIINNWMIDENNGLVQNGTINLSPHKSMQKTPAVSAFLSKLKCKVKNGLKQDMKASLNMEFKNKELRLPGDENGVEKLPKWNKTESLSSDGDWISSASLPEILLSWTGFRLSSPSIIFDFHKKKHAPSVGKYVNNPSWVGVDLGDVTIKPYTFDIIGKNALTIKTSGWVLNDQGVYGHAESIPYSMKFEKGNISFNKIIFDASYGQFKAEYKNMKIYVPWLGNELKGDAVLSKISGQYGLDFSGVTSPTITKSYNQFTLKASNLRFTSEENIGWVIRSSTHFDLRSENKTILEFTVPEFFYGFDGYPYFSKGEKQYSRNLGQSAKLGDTPLKLKQVYLTAHGNGNKALSISASTEVFISENPIIPAADTQIDYFVLKGNPLYSGQGPFLKPFLLDVAFPLGSPSIRAKMTPDYKPENGTRYYGQVDMSMFGGPPVKAQLLMGYKNSKSYFLIRGNIPLGPSGIPMSPLPFSLYRLSGGLGYNFPVNSFYNMSIENAQPDMSGETLFMAGMRIGSSDKFTFMMDGITTVKRSGEAGMKFDAWLLTHNHNNSGQLQGILQYGSGVFSGKIWGNLNLMNNMVSLNLGNDNNNAAMETYFGHGDWHLYAGDKNGQRMEAFILGKKTSEGYLMLGSQIGLAAGGRQSWNLSGGDAAYVKGFMDVGLQITPQPKIKGDFNAGLSAGICVPKIDECISGGVNARIRVSALPLKMRTTVSLDLPWPFSSITFTVNL
jgi:PKD repeat protein